MERGEYPIVMRPDVCTDGTVCFVAEHPDLPGCAAHGSTPDEAKALLDQARAAYIRYLVEKNMPIPGPSLFGPVEWQIGLLGTGSTASGDESPPPWKIQRPQRPAMA